VIRFVRLYFNLVGALFFGRRERLFVRTAPGFRARPCAWNADGEITQAMIFEDDFAVVCRRNGPRDWEPLYGIVEGRQTGLWSAFELNGKSIRALEGAFEEGA
jgi:hypothetical protein